MTSRLTCFLLFCLLNGIVNAQYTHHIVQLKDKKGTSHSLSNPNTYLSPKAIERRTRQKINIDSTDLPISSAYLDSIRSVANVIVLNHSKWLNQVLIRTSDPVALAKINSFPFVRNSSPLKPAKRPDEDMPVLEKFNETIEEYTKDRIASAKSAGDVINYGSSYNQVHIHEGEFLHNLGFTGMNISIAVLDAGFRFYKTNPAFDSVRLQNRILGEWDYVMNEASVNEDDTHGAYCFSIIASNRPGMIVGTAPHAKFWLLRTEDVFSEYPIEEQNWAAAAEFADSAGADMITSSLGYSDFDDPAFDHSYQQRNGNTSIVTVAADLAAKKGMIVMNSAGNSGGAAGEIKYVACPADGDSVVAVGATTVTGIIAGFSSWGPNSAGKIKPNIVSVGQGTILANTAGTPVAGNGTSFSNPNMAGLVACLWQAFPEFTNMEIIDAVQKSSHKYNNPDDRFGYGIPNFRIAHGLLETEREARRIAAILGDQFIRAYPVPFQNQFNIVFKAPADGKATLHLMDAAGRTIEIKKMDVTNNQAYLISFSRSSSLPTGVYFVKYEDGKNKKTIRIVKAGH